MSSAFAGTSRFRLVRSIGAGGFGVVYEAEDREERSRVALKTLTRLDAASLYRFKKEFRGLADVHHPNLVRLRELFSEGDQWFFTMDLVSGVDWLSFVQGRTAPVSEFELEDTLDVEAAVLKTVVTRSAGALTADPSKIRSSLVQLADGLGALHRARLVHRDIKPANVLVTAEGQVIILDFGLATTSAKEGASLTELNAVVGTPAYMAPEQAVGSTSSPATDWYAVGTMLFEALTGALPFVGTPLEVLLEKQRREAPRASSVVKDVPPDLDELCTDLLRADPRQRPTGDALRERLGGRVSTELPRASTPDVGGAIFVGRAETFRHLERLYETSRNGRLALALVHGTSGMGKSAAVKAFLERAGGMPVVLQGRCFQRESVPYKAFDQVIDSLTRYLLSLSRDEAAALLPREVAALARIFPVLERVPAVATAPRRGLDSNDAQLLRRRAFTALRELLTRLSDRRPVILLLDDVQWGDADSAGLLGELTSPPDPPALLFILAYRSEEAKESPLLTAFEHRVERLGFDGTRDEVEIGPLSREEAYELAVRLLGAAPASPHLAAALAEECLGSPFFLGELTQYARSEAPASERKPIRLEDVIALRLSRLSAKERLLLQLTCLSGGRIDRAVAMGASAQSEIEFSETLRALRNGNLVKVAGIRGELVEPFHDRIREAVAADIEPNLNRDLHRAIAAALLVEAEPDPEKLLLHYAAAQMTEDARVQARRAAENAVKALAFDRAATLFSQALSLGGWGEEDRRLLLLAKAEALVNAGRGVQAADAFLGLIDGGTEAEKLDLMRRAGEQLLYAGQIDRGLEVLTAVMRSLGERLPTSPLQIIVGILILRVWLRLRGWSFRARTSEEIPWRDTIRIEVLRALSKAFASVQPAYSGYYTLRLASLALAAGQPTAVLHALSSYATLFMASDGRPSARWSALVAKATALTETLGDPQALPFLEVAQGATLTIAGRFAEGEPFLERSLTYFRERGVTTPWDLNVAMYMWTLNRASAGDYREGGSRLVTYSHDGFDRGDAWLTTNLRISMASVHWLVEDRPKEGRADIAAAIRAWRGGLDVQHWLAVMSIATMDIYDDRPGEALEAVAALAARAQWSTLRFLPLVASRLSNLAFRASVAHFAQQPSETRRLRAVRSWRRRAYRHAVWSDLPIIQLVDAGFAHLVGDVARANDLLKAAHAGAEAGGLAQYVAFSAYRIGQLQGAHEGRSRMESATAWMRQQGIRRPELFLRAHSPGFGQVVMTELVVSEPLRRD